MRRRPLTLLPFLLALAGAAAIVVSLSLDWYELRGESSGADVGKITIDGWSAFETVDVLLVLTALAALTLVLRSWRTRRPLHGAFIPLGVLAMVTVVLQITKKSPQVQFFSDYGGFNSSLAAGPWVAFAGAALLLVAGLLGTLARERS